MTKTSARGQQQPSGQPGKFTTGSTMRHVIVMTGTGSVGLISVFFVDILNLFYISMLGKEELAAAIGYAGTLMFFTLSVSIGLTIATGALVSRALGKGDREEAARTGGAALLIAFLILLALTIAVFPALPFLLGFLGATGNTLDLAVGYTQIVLPTAPMMAIGMGASGILRGVGDAKRAMYITLIGALVAAIADPILIFGLDLELTGAAIATVLSRVVILIVGLHGAYYVHNLVQIDGWTSLKKTARPFLLIGIPAIATQLATPVGNAYVTIEMARFGDEAVAGWAIVGRLVPVAFGAIFALSGAVGPILGQNYGAQLYSRLFQTMRDALIFTTIYAVVIWAIIALFSNSIANAFNAAGATHDLVVFFCLFVAGSFIFNGALFVANAAFNNLGYATYSTVFNWGRATLGTVPFVYLGAKYYGATGVLAGWGLGAVVFGIVSMIVCFRVIAKIERDGGTPGDHNNGPMPPSANSPFTSGKGAIAS